MTQTEEQAERCVSLVKAAAKLYEDDAFYFMMKLPNPEGSDFGEAYNDLHGSRDRLAGICYMMGSPVSWSARMMKAKLEARKLAFYEEQEDKERKAMEAAKKKPQMDAYYDA